MSSQSKLALAWILSLSMSALMSAACVDSSSNDVPDLGDPDSSIKSDGSVLVDGGLADGSTPEVSAVDANAVDATDATSPDAADATIEAGAPGHIVFSRNNGTVNAPNEDLYLINEDGTGEVQLTSSSDREFFNALAPDGRIVFQRTTNGQVDLYSVKPDGTGLVPLATNTDFEVFAAISTKGRVIFRRDTTSGGRDVHAVNADGTNPTPLAATAGNEDFAGITLNDDVIYLVNSNGQNSDLRLVSINGGVSSGFATDPNRNDGLLAITPLGDILYSSSTTFGLTDIYLNVAKITSDTVAGEFELSGITANGQAVIRRKVAGQYDLYLNGSTLVLANSTDNETYVGSTASGRVLYDRLVPVGTTSTFQHELFAVDAVNGGNTTGLGNTANDEHFGAVMPDGRVLFHRDVLGEVNLHVIHADGTGTVRLTTAAAFDQFKAVLPNGRVIFERGVAGGTSLQAVNLDGTSLKQLSGGGNAFFSAVTPSGKVVFRVPAGNSELYIVNPDGSGLTSLGQTGSDEFFVSLAK